MEIANLRRVNDELTSKIADLDRTLAGFSEYFRALSYYDKFNKFNFNLDDNRKIREYTNLEGDLLNIAEYGRVLPVLENIDRNMSFLRVAVDRRIEGLKDVLASVELDNKVDRIYESNREMTEERALIKVKYLGFLESFLNSIPVSKPMKNYYISSRYGNRVDPFEKNTVRMHKGEDLVGARNANIMATADGKVKLVDNKRGFGNYLVLDHGNGVETIYAHLKSVKVNPGDRVKRGDLVAIQGDTGRATGEHLHYEVRVNGTSLDPKKFINAGDRMELEYKENKHQWY